MTRIHPSAIVGRHAEIGNDVSIGPFCIVEDDVSIGDNCQLAGHVVIKSGTELGRHNVISEGAVLGGRPQHLRVGEQVGRLVIGDANSIREHATIHCGLHPGAQTTVGDHNLLMVGVHVGHDACVTDHTILANNVMLAGHVLVEQRAYLSGAVGVHQYCRVGKFAMVGGQAHVNRDIPPFVTVDGAVTRVVGLNTIGLRRHGFTQDQLDQLKAAYRVIYRSSLPWSQLLAELRTRFTTGPAADFFPFLASGTRGFIPERRERAASTLRLVGRDENPWQARRRAA